MHIKAILILAALGLGACSTAPVPTSPRLEAVRAHNQSRLQMDMQAKGLDLGDPLYFRLFKEEAVLEAWVREDSNGRYRLYKSWPVCNFSGTLGPKIKEGDKQAPEGFYTVNARQMNPRSQFHLAFNVGYPNTYDRAHDRNGSALMIHGGCQSIGCFAMTDPAIEDVYLLIDNALRWAPETGVDQVPLHIFPFRMTAENMTRHAASEWAGFWHNLKQGHDLFERTHLVPIADVRNKTYVFEVPEPVISDPLAMATMKLINAMHS